MKELGKLLISSDVEVAITSRREGFYHSIMPPLYFTKKLGVEPLGFLKEDEDKPIFVDKDGIVWFGDGALFEVAFSPKQLPEHLATQVSFSLSHLRKWLDIINVTKDARASVSVAPSEPFDLSLFEDMPEIASACIAGCNPDKNALIEDYSPETISLSDWQYRGCGGHVHMSLSKERWGDALHDNQRNIARMMAITVGNYTNIIGAHYNYIEEHRRHERFGHPGSYRTPTYPDDVKGFEYRAPSNVWLFYHTGIENVFRLVRHALETVLLDETHANFVIREYLERSMKAIVSTRSDISKEILKELKLI